jgi:hypothetical protein
MCNFTAQLTVMDKQNLTEKWVLMTELSGEPLLHHFKLSNFGNVVRIKKGVGHEETFEPKTIGGYKYISFTTRMGNRETIYLHRLVAEFFTSNSDADHTYVIHKDYDRQNNVYTNLEWTDREGLYKHRAVKAGRVAGKKNAKKKAIKAGPNLLESKAKEKAGMKKLVSEYFAVSQ